jgi:hypothetical protein
MAIAKVGATANALSASTASSYDLTMSPTAGNTVVIWATRRSTTITINSITATGGTATFTQRVSQIGTNARLDIWTATNVGAGITKFTVTMSSAVVYNGAAIQYSGVDNTTPMDVAPTVGAPAGSTTAVSAAITPATTDALVLGAVGMSVRANTTTPFKATTAGPVEVGGTEVGTGWTEEYDRWNQGTNTTSISLVIASDGYVTPGVYQASWTLPASIGVAQGSIVLRPAAGATPDASLVPPRGINYGSLIQL